VPTDAEIANHLRRTKINAYNTLKQHLDGLTTHALNMYPQAETASWDTQKLEAEALRDAGPAATLGMAPFLTMVCVVHHGEADLTTRLEQVKIKSLKVLENVDAWAPMAAFVNGLRARTQDLIEVAEDALTVTNLLEAAMYEASTVISNPAGN